MESTGAGACSKKGAKQNHKTMGTSAPTKGLGQDALKGEGTERDNGLRARTIQCWGLAAFEIDWAYT